MSTARELAAWLIGWLGAGLVAAATLWLWLWSWEHDLEWRDAAFPGLGVAALAIGALLRPRRRNRRESRLPQS